MKQLYDQTVEKCNGQKIDFNRKQSIRHSRMIHNPLTKNSGSKIDFVEPTEIDSAIEFSESLSVKSNDAKKKIIKNKQKDKGNLKNEV